MNSIPNIITHIRSRRLPPVLARDYRRNIIWPSIQLYGSLAILAGIIFGAIR